MHTGIVSVCAFRMCRHQSSVGAKNDKIRIKQHFRLHGKDNFQVQTRFMFEYVCTKTSGKLEPCRGKHWPKPLRKRKT